MDVAYLDRACDLASLGIRNTKSNPMVGAVLVYSDRIIGEGFHEKYGSNHAEVNAINSVSEKDKGYISKCTLYVTLEPCCFTGKTPACTSLILESKIQNVVIGVKDPYEKVAGKGIEILKKAGLTVIVANHKRSKLLIDNFITNTFEKRPWVIAKVAKSKDNFISKKEEQTWLTSPVTGIYTHKLRSEVDAILVGTNTAIIDNPSLTLRNYPGVSPIRIVIDLNHKIPKTHKLLNDENPLLIITKSRRIDLKDSKEQVILSTEDENFESIFLAFLYERGINRLLIEGGAKLLSSFLKQNLIDEAVVISTNKILREGVKAPNISGSLQKSIVINEDNVVLVRVC